jgi:hypothetical protein
MASVCTTPTCPELCDDVMPSPKFRVCNPQFTFGQISDIYVTNIGNPLIDETSPVEWAARLALPANDPAKIIRLVVMAEKPDAEVPETEASHGRKAYGLPKHMITGVIDEVSDENYDFMRAIRCGKTVLLWYKLLGGKAYGGATGVEATMKIGHAIPLSAQELETLPFTFSWQAQIDPCRFDHPLQGDDSDLESES